MPSPPDGFLRWLPNEEDWRRTSFGRAGQSTHLAAATMPPIEEKNRNKIDLLSRGLDEGGCGGYGKADDLVGRGIVAGDRDPAISPPEATDPPDKSTEDHRAVFAARRLVWIGSKIVHRAGEMLKSNTTGGRHLPCRNAGNARLHTADNPWNWVGAVFR